MMRKPASVSLEGLARVLPVATCGSMDFRKKTILDQTAAGRVIEASGTAEVRTSGPHQRFKVSMDARVAAGTTFLVLVNNGTARNKIAGTITIDLFGNGELELNNNGKVLPSGIAPASTISSVEVKDGNGMGVLKGSF